MLVYIIIFLVIVIIGLLYLIIALKDGIKETEEQRDLIYKLYVEEHEKYLNVLYKDFNGSQIK